MHPSIFYAVIPRDIGVRKLSACEPYLAYIDGTRFRYRKPDEHEPGES